VNIRTSSKFNIRTICDICGKRYTSVGNLNAHKNSAHYGQKWRCKICGRICQTKRAVKISCRNHHPGEDLEFVTPNGPRSVSSEDDASTDSDQVSDDEEFDMPPTRSQNNGYNVMDDGEESDSAVIYESSIPWSEVLLAAAAAQD